LTAKKEKHDKPGEFDQYLGQLDMEQHPLWEEAWIGQDQSKFEQILFEMGADLDYGYDFRVCNYRARTTNQTEYGVRVGFKERTDKRWMSEMMAIEDVARNTVGGLSNALARVGMLESIGHTNPLLEIMHEGDIMEVGLTDVSIQKA
jgi:hypothetical protein